MLHTCNFSRSRSIILVRESAMRTKTVDRSEPVRTTNASTLVPSLVGRVPTAQCKTMWPYAGVPGEPLEIHSETVADSPETRYVLPAAPTLTVRFVSGPFDYLAFYLKGEEFYTFLVFLSNDKLLLIRWDRTTDQSADARTPTLETRCKVADTNVTRTMSAASPRSVTGSPTDARLPVVKECAGRTPTAKL